MENVKKAAKAITAAAVPLAGSLVTWWATGEYSAEEIGMQFMALVSAIAVYVVPNKQADDGRD